MAVGPLRRLASQAPASVHVAIGAGARSAVAGLRAGGQIEIVASPRHASVLLVAGAVPAEMLEMLARVHDQLPEPRAVVWWGGTATDALGISGTVAVDAETDVRPVLADVHRQLVTGERSSSAPVGPATSPVPWQGVGPHGQGGEGMMGGKPYGRSMAMTGTDVRDGLQLDRVPLRIGPFLPGLPPGLTLDLELQGDVVQQARTAPIPFASADMIGARLPSVDDVFESARATPVPVARLELGRARYHLLRLSDGLALYGLTAAARRVAERAAWLTPDDLPRLSRLRRWVGRRWTLWGATAGVGILEAEVLEAASIGGTVARASGLAVDARAHHPVYRSLGFEVTTRADGDARARWLQRVDEAIQALELAAVAGDATVGPHDGVEDPRAASRQLLEHLPHMLTGLEWGDAVTTIASLDLDLEAAAVDRPTAQAR